MPFAALYDALGQRLATERGAERSVLLLYLLLHGCQAFQVCLAWTLPSTARVSCAQSDLAAWLGLL